jgi:beta-fructofuranosidase
MKTRKMSIIVPVLALIITAYPQLDLPAWPDEPPDDWKTYHLAHPGPGGAEPGDPNAAIYYQGLYHMHYIYQNSEGHAFAHVSSEDMVYWKWHPTVLTKSFTGHGMYSGTAFLTKEGQPAAIYHGEGSGRNQLIRALDDSLNQWSEPEAVIPLLGNGEEADISNWDPDLWLNGDTYYALSGGEDPDLMKSDDLENWLSMGKLLHDDFPSNIDAVRSEDISCANMFPIGNKWMLLCINHERGARYYLGDFVGEKYLPDFHAMMNWIPNGWNQEVGPYFAPESMLTPDGRRVMWAWILYNVEQGIQSLPRELELPADGVLRIKPLTELAKLRHNPVSLSDITVTSAGEYQFSGPAGDAVECKVVFKAPLPDEFGVKLLGDNSELGGITITAGASKTTLDLGPSGEVISPPFQLANGEDLTLRIFVDKNLVEVFANDRQAAVTLNPEIRLNPNIRLFTSDADVVVSELTAWNMRSTYDEPPPDPRCMNPLACNYDPEATESCYNDTCCRYEDAEGLCTCTEPDCGGAMTEKRDVNLQYHVTAQGITVVNTGKISVKVRDTRGQTAVTNSGREMVFTSFAGLEPGIYVVEVLSDEQMSTRIIVVF